MNQENNFNSQGNNGMPNGQSLNNQNINNTFNQNVQQSENVNQTTFNSQPQLTPNYQQSINQMNMQQPTPQPMNSFDTGSANNQSFNSKPPKKMNLGLIIGIVAAVAVIGIGIVLGSKLLSNGDKKTSSLNNKDSDVNVNINNNEQPNNMQDSKYDNWANITGTSIYVNYRDGRRKDVKSSSIVFHSNHTDMVALHYNKVDAFTGKVEDVFDFLNNGVVFSDIGSYSEANFLNYSKTYEITPTSTKAVSFGDIKAIEIKGNVVDANGRNCYVYGYTFVINGIPCFLSGFVFTEAQEQSMIDSISIEVDEMIKTVRTER